MATAIHSGDFRHNSGGSTETFLPHLWHRMGDTLHVWHERVVARRELAELDDYMLHDIGLTRTDVIREVEKPFWQA